MKTVFTIPVRTVTHQKINGRISRTVTVTAPADPRYESIAVVYDNEGRRWSRVANSFTSTVLLDSPTEARETHPPMPGEVIELHTLDLPVLRSVEEATRAIDRLADIALRGTVEDDDAKMTDELADEASEIALRLRIYVKAMGTGLTAALIFAAKA